MFAAPHRTKGAGPLLGARHVGESGPFGRRVIEDAEPDEDDDEQHDQDHDQDHDEGKAQ